MSARLPLLGKAPFVLDPRPLEEATSAHAGLLSVSRAFRSLGIPAMVDANLPLRKRERGFSEAQIIESVVLLQVAGGECPEDIGLLADDACIQRGLGYAPPRRRGSFWSDSTTRIWRSCDRRGKIKKALSSLPAGRWRPCRKSRPAACGALPNSMSSRDRGKPLRPLTRTPPLSRAINKPPCIIMRADGGISRWSRCGPNWTWR